MREYLAAHNLAARYALATRLCAEHAAVYSVGNRRARYRAI